MAAKYSIGDKVRKKSGSWWEGKIVGYYSTIQTPIGYAVQLETPDDNGPVQIYPEGALEYNNNKKKASKNRQKVR